MNIITIIGIILAVLGAIALIYGGITYTSSENVIDMGSVHLQVDQTKQILRSPVAGIFALAAGIVLIVVGRRRPSSGKLL